MRKVAGWCVVLGSVLALGAGVATQPGADAGGKLPFTVSREMTGIVGPLDGEGRPDYVRLLNEEAGEGLPAEENGVVAWLRVVGTEQGYWGGDGEWKDVLRRLGAKDLPQKGEWESIEAYLNGGREVSWGTEEPRLAALGRRVWTEEDDEKVAGYLKKEAGVLGKLREIAAGAGWYAPAPRFGNVIDDEGFWPALREGGEGLQAEGTLAFARGDFERFFENVQAEMRLARMVDVSLGSEPFVTAWRMEEEADGALGAALGSGRCTRAQLARIRGLLKSMKPLDGPAQLFDRRIRWRLLDSLMCYQEARTDWKKVPEALGEEVPSLLLATQRVDWADMDGDVMLRGANEFMDSEVAALRMPTYQQCAEATAALERKFVALKTQAMKDAPDAWPRAGETKAAFSARFGRVFLAFFAVTPSMINRVYWEGRMEDEMVGVMLAAATYREDEGKWPLAPDDLVPGYLEEVPEDVDATSAGARVGYGFSDGGAYVSSVGRKGRADGGSDGEIVVGVK